MVHFIALMIFTGINIFTFTKGNGVCPKNLSHTVIRRCDGNIHKGFNILVDFLAINKLCSCEINFSFEGYFIADMSIAPNTVNKRNNTCGTQIVITYFEEEISYGCNGARKAMYGYIGRVLEMEIRYRNGTPGDEYSFHFCPYLRSKDNKITFSVMCRPFVGSSIISRAVISSTSLNKQSSVQNTTDMSVPPITVVINNYKKKKKSLNWEIIIGAVGGGELSLIIVAVFILLYIRRKRKAKIHDDDHAAETRQALQRPEFNITDDGITENPLYHLSKSDENFEYHSAAENHYIHLNGAGDNTLTQDCKTIQESAPIYAIPEKRKMKSSNLKSKRKATAQDDDNSDGTQQALQRPEFNINGDGLTKIQLDKMSQSDDNFEYYSSAADNFIHSNSAGLNDLNQDCKKVHEAPIYAMPEKTKIKSSHFKLKRKATAQDDGNSNESQQTLKRPDFNIYDDRLTENPLYHLSQSDDNLEYYSSAADHYIHSNNAGENDINKDCKKVHEASIYAMPEKPKIKLSHFKSQ